MDAQAFLSKLPGIPFFSKYSPEKHAIGYSYLGANTRLDKRLNSNDEPYENERPINMLDTIAMYHDISYRDAELYNTTKEDILKAKHLADQKMLENLNNYHPTSVGESILWSLTKKIIGPKLKLGLGVVVTQDIAAELHHKIFVRFVEEKL